MMTSNIQCLILYFISTSRLPSSPSSPFVSSSFHSSHLLHSFLLFCSPSLSFAFLTFFSCLQQLFFFFFHWRNQYSSAVTHIHSPQWVFFFSRRIRRSSCNRSPGNARLAGHSSAWPYRGEWRTRSSRSTLVIRAPCLEGTAAESATQIPVLWAKSVTWGVQVTHLRCPKNSIKELQDEKKKKKNLIRPSSITITIKLVIKHPIKLSAIMKRFIKCQDIKLYVAGEKKKKRTYEHEIRFCTRNCYFLTRGCRQQNIKIFVVNIPEKQLHLKPSKT